MDEQGVPLPTDAEQVDAAFNPPPEEPAAPEAPRRGPGRPPGSKTTRKHGKRGAGGRFAPKAPGAGAAPAPGATPAVPSPEVSRFWGQQLCSVWNQAAHLRGWPMLPGAPVDQAGMPLPPTDPEVFLATVGEPFAKVMDSALPMVDERPWLQVLVILAPWIGGAVRVELSKFAATRDGARRPLGRETRPVADDPGDGLGPSRLRTEGQREDLASAEFVGAPILPE